MKLIRIEEFEKCESWDIEVENSHNFYAEKVLVHNSNSAIAKYPDGTYQFQSRERELNLTEKDGDNASFMRTNSEKNYQKLFEGIEFESHCVIYGEWCGGNIQKTVALNKLPKMWVIFAVKIDDVYQDMNDFKHLMNEDELIYNITQFPSFEIEIDFNAPELVQNDIVDMTLAVEKECPVGKYFGISGIGEGIVFEYIDGDTRFIFKSKGVKHQNSKCKTLAPVDVEEIKNLKEFVEYAVTDNRLAQGIDKMRELGKPIDEKTTGDYLRWVFNDVIKEESDTMEENGIEKKKIGSHISAKARMYWFKYLNDNM